MKIGGERNDVLEKNLFESYWFSFYFFELQNYFILSIKHLTPLSPENVPIYKNENKSLNNRKHILFLHKIQIISFIKKKKNSLIKYLMKLNI